MTSPAPADAARTSAPRRGLNGALLRAWRARDTRLTVLAREEVSEHFVRLRVDLGGLEDELYPTYWLRLWFTAPSGGGHQRAYTVVDPDPASGTAALEFFLHPGIASDWARGARPGDRIDASVLNGRDPLADSPPHLLLIGDGASVPAFADLLARTPEQSATVLLERGYADDEHVLPIRARAGAEVHWHDRDGRIEQEALAAAFSAPDGTRAVIALESAATRAVSAALRAQGWPKDRVHALAYWKRTRRS